MVQTPSTMAPLGTVAPDFILPEPATGRDLSLSSLSSLSDVQGPQGLLVAFLSNHCPFVKHIAHGLAEFGREYQGKGLAIVGINSNDPEAYPDDAPERMAEEVERVGYTFPYLFDESQDVAKAYRAACTPDFFLFDGEGRLVYRGQFDDSRPGNGEPVTGADLRAAADEVLAGRKPDPDSQRASLGCNIKWRPGNAPR